MQTTIYNQQEEFDEELVIDLKKILFLLWNRKFLILKCFVAVLIFFILLTFISAKKYIVSTDLYINKTNNSNMAEINPYFIEELGGTGGGVAAMMAGGNSAMINELELMKSPLVIDKVIRENNLVYRKKWGILPNKREGEYISTAAFLGKGKNPVFENKKGTNVITIEFKSSDPELAYNILNSIVKNYIDLHKQLNTEKSKSDKQVIESEYKNAKRNLNAKVNSMNGLPEQAMANTGTLSAMSAFSQSARQALSGIKNQVISGERSRIEVTEEAAKVAELSSKLEWAKMVENMSDSSKVLVLKEPQKLRDFEYSSPRLFINIILGIIFGGIASLLAVIIAEIFDKKLSYSMLDENIVYNLREDFSDIKLILLANQTKKIAIISFENIPEDILRQLQEYRNLNIIKADISQEFVSFTSQADGVFLLAEIGKTQSKLFKQVKTILAEMNKKIIKEVLLKA